MNYEQASSLLTRSDLDISIEESRRRIQKVPIKALPDLQKLSQKSVFLTNGFFIYLSDAQLQALDCSLLTPKQIHNLFPGFTLDTFHPGYTHTQEVRKGKIYHFFESEKEGAAYGYFQDELDQLCTERKEQCRVFASRFTPKQKEILKSRVHPEVRELLA